MFLPGGPPNLGFVKAYNENGLRQAGIEFLGTAETDEFDLQKFGDSALGLSTAFHYSAAHDSDENRRSSRRWPGSRKDTRRQLRLGRRLGRHVRDPQDDRSHRRQARWRQGDRRGAALKWESPRGPVSIDPKTRHITQNVYLRTVEKGAAACWSTRKCRASAPQVDHGLGK